MGAGSHEYNMCAPSFSPYSLNREPTIQIQLFVSSVVIRFKNIPALNPSLLCVLKMIAELYITHATNDNPLSKMNFRSLSFYLILVKNYLETSKLQF